MSVTSAPRHTQTLATYDVTSDCTAGRNRTPVRIATSVTRISPVYDFIVSSIQVVMPHFGQYIAYKYTFCTLVQLLHHDDMNCQQNPNGFHNFFIIVNG